MAIVPRPADTGNRARAAFDRLSANERRQAVIDLAAIYPPYTIAAACGLSIEAVRAILAEGASS